MSLFIIIIIIIINTSVSDWNSISPYLKLTNKPTDIVLITTLLL